jgi:hypothetical protein
MRHRAGWTAGVSGDGLAVDADEQVVGGLLGQTLGDELLDGRAGGHLDVVGEAGSLVIDEQDFHE